MKKIIVGLLTITGSLICIDSKANDIPNCPTIITSQEAQLKCNWNLPTISTDNIIWDGTCLERDRFLTSTRLNSDTTELSPLTFDIANYICKSNRSLKDTIEKSCNPIFLSNKWMIKRDYDYFTSEPSDNSLLIAHIIEISWISSSRRWFMKCYSQEWPSKNLPSKGEVLNGINFCNRLVTNIIVR